MEPATAGVHVRLVDPLVLAVLAVEGPLLEALQAEGETGAELLRAQGEGERRGRQLGEAGGQVARGRAAANSCKR